MYRCLVAVCLLFSIQTFANDKANQAALAYGQRDYTEAGIKKVQEAQQLYDEAIAGEGEGLKKLQLMLAQTSVYYFLGSALDQKNEKMAAHQRAMDLADTIIEAMGVDSKKAYQLSGSEIQNLLNKLDDENELLLADAMYSKGISLGQWGRLNGIASSIGQLPEVLGLMERVEMLGYESIHEYGPYRTIGRVKFILPKIFGGDLSLSESFLKDAYRNSLATGQQYSVNGYNNLYLAETLYKRGKETQAIRLLDTFLASDFSKLAEGSEPENREALRLAQELADSWK